jgi:DNA adenine methylase
VRTPLTYYGGKQLLARQIVPLLPPHRVYLEPFAGGAAVLFAKPPADRETLNDADGRIMRFWRVLRERPQELAAAVATTPYGRKEWEASRTSGDDLDDVEAARLLLVNVDQSFSRSRRSWSVPCIGDGRGRWQPGTWANLPEKIIVAAERLKGVALEHGDALELIPRWDRQDALIYLDPPYAGPNRLSPRHGYEVESVGLWPGLLAVLRTVQHAAIVLSGYPCEETHELEASGWTATKLRMKRTVQTRTGGTLPDAPETIWSNQRLATNNLFDEGSWGRAVAAEEK